MKKPLIKALGLILSAALIFGSVPASALPTLAEEVPAETDATSEVSVIDTGNAGEESDAGSTDPDTAIEGDDAQEEEPSKQDIPEQEEEPADAQPSYTFDGNEEYLQSGDIFTFNWKAATDDEINHVCGVTSDVMLGEWLNAMDESSRQELLARETMLAGDYQLTTYEQTMDDEDEDASSLTEGGCYAEYLMDYAKEKARTRATNYWNGSTGYYDKEIYVGNTLKYAWRVKVEIYRNSDLTESANKTEVGLMNWCKYTFVSKSGSLAGTGITVALDADQRKSMTKSSASDDSYLYITPQWNMNVPTGYAVTNTIYNGTSANGAGFAKETYLSAVMSVSDYVVTFSGKPFVTSAYGAGGLLLRDYIRSTAYLSNGYHTGSTTGDVKAGSLTQRYYFSPATYYVDYNGNGATSGTTARSVATYGTPQSVAANGFTKAYTVTYNANKEDVASPAPGVATAVFTGWTDAAGKAVTSLYNLTGANGGVVTLKANWKNGSVTLPTLSKSGYRFGGWSTAQGLKGANTAYTPTQNETVKAQWVPNQYTIVLDADGGELISAGKSYDVLKVPATYDVPVTLPTADDMEAPDEDHQFNGWKTETGIIYSGGASCSNLTDVNGATVNLTADWVKSNDPLWYNVMHYIQKTPGGAYELFRTEKKKAERDSVVTPPLLKEAVDTVNAIEGCKCEQPQLLTVTISKENMSVEYYYACVKKPVVGSGDLTEDAINEIAKKLAAGLSFSMEIAGVEYEIVQNPDGTLAIKFASTTAEKVVIPDVIQIGDKVYRITEVYEKAFKDNQTLKEVVISQNVSKIGASAFEGCKNLEKVTLQEGLVTIGDKAFKDCSSLTGIKMPATLQTISNSAFENCIKLKTVTLNEGLLKIGNKAFYNCKALTKIRIPKTVLKIGRYAFGNCIKLKTAKFATDAQLLTLGTGVFSNCTVLSKIKLPDKLTNVPAKAFYKCKKLATATIGKSVTKINAAAFRSCSSLKKITIPGKVQTIGKNAFYNCGKLAKVRIKSKALTSVGSKAFKKCKKGLTIVVPGNKTAAYKKLFNGKY